MSSGVSRRIWVSPAESHRREVVRVTARLAAARAARTRLVAEAEAGRREYGAEVTPIVEDRPGEERRAEQRLARQLAAGGDGIRGTGAIAPVPDVTSQADLRAVDAAAARLEQANRDDGARLRAELQQARTAVARRRRVERATARLDAARQEQRRLVADAASARRTHGDRVSPVVPVDPPAPPANDPAALERSAATLEAVNVEAAALLAEQVHEARLAAVGERMAGTTRDVDVARERARHLAELRAIAEAPPAAESWRRDVAAAVEGALAILSADVGEEARDRLTEAAAAVLAVGTQRRAEALAGDLRQRCGLANRHAAERRAVEETAGQLAAELVGLDGEEAAGLLRLLAEPARIAVADLPGLRATVEEVATRARRAADHRFAAQELSDVLAGLGFEVAEGFSTVVGEAGFGYARIADWNGYAVRVRLQDDERVTFRVVRAAGTDGSYHRDTEVEGDFCSRFAHFDAAVNGRGAITVKDDPGRFAAGKVVPVADEVLPTDWAQARRPEIVKKEGLRP